MITIVTGLGRCGSSLAMKMLKAGGFDVVGTLPLYEDNRSSIGKFDADWLLEQDGKVVKCLSLHHLPIKKGEYRFIVLTRDIEEQAKSQIKFRSQIVDGFKAKKTFAKSQIRKQQKQCLNKAKLYGPVLQLKFEDFFERPIFTIGRMLQFMDAEDTVESSAMPMYETIKPRSTKCMPDMRIEGL